MQALFVKQKQGSFEASIALVRDIMKYGNISSTHQTTILSALEKTAQQIDYEKYRIATLKCMAEISTKRRGLLNTVLNEAELEYFLLGPLTAMICDTLGCQFDLEYCKNRLFYRFYTSDNPKINQAAVITAVKYGADIKTVTLQTTEYYCKIKEEEPCGNIKVVILLSETNGNISFVFILFPFTTQQGSVQYLMLPEHNCTADKLDVVLELVLLLTTVNYEAFELPSASSEKEKL
ncbi:uncharacterized protein [Dysidea avara]|uniref:uncharacterized protein n=1 Tax=Dysidea avara TaxID=196820 RepID=UPI003323BD2F